jgi:hypothetical protein
MGRASPISQVVSKPTAELRITNSKAFQASAGALEMTLCLGAGVLYGNLEQTIRQQGTPPTNASAVCLHDSCHSRRYPHLAIFYT